MTKTLVAGLIGWNPAKPDVLEIGMNLAHIVDIDVGRQVINDHGAEPMLSQMCDAIAEEVYRQVYEKPKADMIKDIADHLRSRLPDYVQGQTRDTYEHQMAEHKRLQDIVTPPKKTTTMWKPSFLRKTK